MSKTPLYKMLQDVPSSGGWTLATLLDGSVSGSQLLLHISTSFGYSFMNPKEKPGLWFL